MDMARRGNRSHVTAMRGAIFWLAGCLLPLLTSGETQTQVTVKCITDGQRPEIYLHCEDGGLINILSAEVGNQELPQDTLVCVEQTPTECVVSVPDVGPLFAHCMGLSTCNKVIDTPKEDRCANIVNYIQIYYQCIPVPATDTFAIIDICGDVFGTLMTSITRDSGYIRSLHYPRGYSPLTSCSCNLTALDPGTSIRFRILDMDLSPSEQRLTVGHDWLEYSQSLDQWGDGHKLNHLARGHVIDTELPLVYLNFRTGAGLGGRGFWIQYYGVTGDGGEGDIKLQCGQFTPSDYKTDISCFADSPSGELYLTCESQGAINVLSAIQGYSPLVTQSDCTVDQSNDCTRTLTQDPELLKKCMRQTTCYPPARSTHLDCGHSTNYMYVLYQCIKVDAHVDMCGDATQKHTIIRDSGYLETLNYPDGYFSNQKCTCRLEAVDDDTEIVLSLVDIDLDTNDCTLTKDWIEFTAGRQNWAKGVRLCGNVPGEPIHTGTRKLYLNFYSDSAGNGRGVWLKYMGKKEDDTLADVRVTCGIYSPYRDLPDLINTDLPPYYTGPNTQKIAKSTNHTGLIVGLTVTAVFMVVVITVMIIFKYKRPRKQAEDTSTAPGGPPSAIARLDTGYGTLKYPGFSTRKNGHGMPYTNLDEEVVRSGSEKANDFRDTSPIISRTSDILDLATPQCSNSSNGSSASANSSEPTSVRSEIAYNNPAFDGEWERDQDYCRNIHV